MNNRRHFIKTGSVLLAGAALRPQLALAATPAAARFPLPTPAQVAWQDCEIGVMYSFDLAIAAGDTTENNAARKTCKVVREGNIKAE